VAGRRPELDVALGDGGFPALRAVRRGVRAEAGACPVLLGGVPGGVAPGACGRAVAGGDGAGLVGGGDGGFGAAAGRGAGLDLPQALAVVSEAVWWVTMVDATVVRYQHDAYDRVLAGLDPAGRRRAEGTLGGLRFVRNWMGYHADPADFIAPQQAAGGGDLPVAEWTWVAVPAPAAGPAPRSREWEMSRYRHATGRCWRASRSGARSGRRSRSCPGSRPVGDHAGKNSLPA
jgi:hypothetical protein